MGDTSKFTVFFVCTVWISQRWKKDRGVKFCMPVQLLSGEVFSHSGGQRSTVKVTRDKKRAHRRQHPHECVQMICAHCKRRAAAAYSGSGWGISWRPRGTRLGGHSELGAAASTKAVWWDLRLASLLMHLS